MPEISEKARQVLEYITKRESSIPPSVREIGAALQIKSTSTVHKYLTELAAAGYIEKGDKMNRAISLPQQNSTRVQSLNLSQLEPRSIAKIKYISVSLRNP